MWLWVGRGGGGRMWVVLVEVDDVDKWMAWAGSG